MLTWELICLHYRKACPYCGMPLLGPQYAQLGPQFAPFDGMVVHPECEKALAKEL
jgi:hypothetical protein